MKRILPLAAMEKLLKKAGAPRVSDSAKKALSEILENYSAEISEKAIRIAYHAKRKTIKAEDIKLAQK
ncbi:histone family protein [Candidatus Woesearchaeota archaeon]|nr:histone family protein [Candidatus Woesearchaeota archaeon]